LEGALKYTGHFSYITSSKLHQSSAVHNGQFNLSMKKSNRPLKHVIMLMGVLLNVVKNKMRVAIDRPVVT
jgi:hypothetical protein